MNPDATNEVLRFDVGDLRSPGASSGVRACDGGGLRGAAPLSHVRGVQRAVAVTPWPGAPEIIDGVLDVRGAVVPVIDLGRRFGLPRRPLRASQSMVLVWTG